MPEEPNGQISNSDLLMLLTLADRAPLYPHERAWLNRVAAQVAAILNPPAPKPPEPKPEPPPAQEA